MIVAVSVAYVDAMAAIHASSFPPTEAWDAAAFLGLLDGPGMLGLVSEAGGFILARKAADQADIVTLAVLPERRRQGLGRILLDRMLALLRSHGVAAVFLEVSRTNFPAYALYVAAGFQEVGTRRGYYPDGTDAVVMRRS